LRISEFSAGDFARIRQAISLQSGTLLRRVLGARLDVSLLTGDPILPGSLKATTLH
jgi:hypothetical protein